jgi:hypothetical protein
MAKIQAYCGLDCGECEAYIATQINDRAGLEKTATAFFAFAPALKEKLEAIRKELGK